MYRPFLSLLCIVSIAFAGTDLPDLNGNYQQHENSDTMNKPERENPPDLSTSSRREEDQREENVSSYTETPKQEIPSFPGIILSTSDVSDSNDSVYSLPPHILLAPSKE